jgi:hypothetical protein
VCYSFSKLRVQQLASSQWADSSVDSADNAEDANQRRAQPEVLGEDDGDDATPRLAF